MDLKSMLEREDFFSFFFDTVKKYYKEALDEDIEIDFAKNNSECNMVIKPELSAATSTHMSNKAREFYFSEWNIRDSIIKNIIAKTYIYIITRTGKSFSQFKFTMKPADAVSPDVLIAPNNRSIRVFDYGDDTVGCIIKSGFTSKYFNNQLQFRINYNYDFIVPLISYGKDWFREPIMHGHPLARVINNNDYKKGLLDTQKNIDKLANDTIEYINLSEYINHLVNSLYEMLDRAIAGKSIKRVDETRHIIDNAKSRLLHFSKKEIPTCISHGDLQTGNIWLDNKKKIWIYDWETVGRRSLWYDSCVLNYSLRRPDGWERFLLSEKLDKLSGISLYNIEAEDIIIIKYIVLLEDLCFYFEDMLELPETWGADIFDSFIDRLISAGL